MNMILLTEGETMSRLFNLDWQLVADSCLTIIAVFVLLFFMSYFLFNPARKFLNDRKERIQGELLSAKNDQETAAALKAEYEEKLRHVDKEAESILADARKRAIHSESQIVEQAKAEAAQIIASAQREAQLEKQKLSDEIQQEIVRVATAMAGRFIAAGMDDATQKRLIDETLGEMGESTWQG